MNNPELTVLMTVRNGNPYLKEAVSSILNQTYQNFRFLILDNASIDDSREVIRSFKDDRIELVELPQDIGQTAALNRGLEMVSTTWVARMDADDVSLPNRLELQMEYLRENQDIVLLGTGVILIDGQGRRFRDSIPAASDVELRWAQLVAGNGGIAHSAAVFSTGAVRNIGGYPQEFKYSQDYALWCRLANQGGMANLSHLLVKVRKHESNTTVHELMEKEIRTVMRGQLAPLLDELDDDELETVISALRYEASRPLDEKTGQTLKQLPERFEKTVQSRLSSQTHRAYVDRWLYMAVQARGEGKSSVPWLRLAVSLGRTVFTRAAFWKAVGISAIYRFRRPAGRSSASPTNGDLAAARRE